jgi:hypothetical protein
MLSEVQKYLKLAATLGPGNKYDYVFKKLVNTKEYFYFQAIVDAFKELEKDDQANIPEKAIDSILLSNGFKLRESVYQTVVTYNKHESVAIPIISLLWYVLKDHDEFKGKIGDLNEFIRKHAQKPDLDNCQKGIQQYWSSKVLEENKEVQPLLNKIAANFINDNFSNLENEDLQESLPLLIKDLSGFTDPKDFEAIIIINQNSRALAILFNSIIKGDTFKAHSEELVKLFQSIDYSTFDYGTLFNLLNLLTEMPKRDYSEILVEFFKLEPELRSDALNSIKLLDAKALPSSFIAKIISTVKYENVNAFISTIKPIFDKNPGDPILSWMFSKNANLNENQLQNIASITSQCELFRFDVSKLLRKLQTIQPSQLDQVIEVINAIDNPKKAQILEIIAHCAATNLSVTDKTAINYSELITKLNMIDPIAPLYNFIQNNPVRLSSLVNEVSQHSSEPLETLLSALTKKPFGERDLQKQFSTERVETVINQFWDMNHDCAYTKNRRLQIMEAFNFINAAGHELAIYPKSNYGPGESKSAAAKDLTNEEIKDLFHKIKHNHHDFEHLNAFQRHLYALGLMREAIYRTTGEFPYSTQMIALIDCIMQAGDVISNIDTGQGKSMIDTMKAALLFLDSDRVDIATSSIDDANRDLAIYSPFLTLLDIPHLKSAVTVDTPINDEQHPEKNYKAKGINFSTMKQLELLHLKTLAQNTPIGSPDDVVSLVMNESDYIILDDKAVARYAKQNTDFVGNEWIYYEVNNFVQGADFRADTTSAQDDIDALRAKLERAAAQQGKSTLIIDQIEDSKLSEWINSALLVQHHLQEKKHYLLTTDPTPIGNTNKTTRRALLLGEDKNINAGHQFGHGQQQLLYADLNAKSNNESYFIEPESDELASMTNREMINFYRNKKGHIWGSSGSVGSQAEIQRQYEDYGFAFSKVAPHQNKKSNFNNATFARDEQSQFEAIYKRLLIDQRNGKPSLVFLKDIKTAERFKSFIDEKMIQNSQLFIGLGNVAQVTERAAEPGMITITTALGRNTNIRYDRSKGMSVYLGYIDHSRDEQQKAGRTGREGSEGDVYPIYNQEDLKGKRKEQIVHELEDKAKRNSEYYKPLQLINGYLLRKLENIDPVFINKNWSKLSRKIEDRYREGRNQLEDNIKDIRNEAERNQAIEKFVKGFCNYAVQEFNKEVTKFQKDSPVNAEIKELLDEFIIHPANEDYFDPNEEEVTLQDCTDPNIIAYGYLNDKAKTQNVANDILEANLKEELRKVFNAIKGNNANEIRNTHINYVKHLQDHANLPIARKVHQEFIREFLQAESNVSSSTGFITRWRQSQGHLNKVASNADYLMMFKVLMDVGGNKEKTTDEMKDVIKSTIIRLLREYRDQSWWISPFKRRETDQLIKNIGLANDITHIITLITDSKVDVLTKDITTSQTWYKRRVNRDSHSRFQETLDRALDLTAAITGQSTANLSKNLTEQLGRVADKSNEAPTELKSHDHYLAKKGLFGLRNHKKYTESHAVVDRSLEASLKRNPNKDDAMKTRDHKHPTKRGK